MPEALFYKDDVNYLRTLTGEDEVCRLWVTRQDPQVVCYSANTQQNKIYYPWDNSDKGRPEKFYLPRHYLVNLQSEEANAELTFILQSYDLCRR